MRRFPTGHRALAIALALTGIAASTADATPAGSASTTVPVVNEPEIWKDPAQPPGARARDLARRMSLEEKTSQILANAPSIPRLGIAAYSHRNECLHGVVSGRATVFPQAIGMAATWDVPLIREEADAIATEGRAKHNDYIAGHDGNSGERAGVNFYSPNINIFRDPRWGRGQETYGEDPFLTARIGVAFIRGLQGDDPTYFKAVACAKHFAVHSGPEKGRHSFDARPSDRDLRETYLPAFEAAVREGQVYSLMGAYSSLYGQPCCADSFLLTDLLRKQWGFNGVVFSDGGAIGDIWAEHKFVPGPEEAAVAAVKAGCDVSSGGMQQGARGGAGTPGHANNGLKGGYAFSVLPAAVQKGLIAESQVDTAVERELEMRFRLGLFDPPESVPFSKIGIDRVDTPEHRALALKVAQESVVLLKNDGVLPLDRARIRHIAVIGPNADSAAMLNGNYAGQTSHSVTIFEGITKLAGRDVEVTHVAGCPLALRDDKSNQPAQEATAQAVAAAKSSDVVVFVSGIDASLEKEEGGAREKAYEGFDRGDRTKIELPPVQEELLMALSATGKPIVLVNCSGSAMAMPWEAEHLPAILQAWYPGEEGGQAVAQVLFGEVNPAGRLPVTIYRSTADLPPFDDYSMAERTYRYFSGKPLFPFGHGLSYTHFKYSEAELRSTKASAAAGPLHVRVTIRNTGLSDGDEVVQIYVRHPRSAVPQPIHSLCAFQRVSVAKGQTQVVAIDIPMERMRHWDERSMAYIVEPGPRELQIGASSQDIRIRREIEITP